MPFIIAFSVNSGNYSKGMTAAKICNFLALNPVDVSSRLRGCSFVIRFIDRCVFCPLAVAYKQIDGSVQSLEPRI